MIPWPPSEACCDFEVIEVGYFVVVRCDIGWGINWQFTFIEYGKQKNIFKNLILYLIIGES